MRVSVAALTCLVVGCGFQVPNERAIDAPGPPTEKMPDTPDGSTSGRTRDGLIGLWEFNETTGTVVADTSDITIKVPLTVSVGSVTFASGMMTPGPTLPTVVASAASPHINGDIIGSGAVTLEVWVSTPMDDQSATGQPVVVAGLDASINSRNISILQDHKRWVGRVRTTADANGGPDLRASQDITAAKMTQVMIVADATHRLLYVDGKLDVTDPAPSALMSWDASYKMIVGDEGSQNRQWNGTFALVAIYKRILAQDEIDRNYAAGPNP